MFTKGKWDAQPVRMEETTFKGPYCCIYAPGPMFPTCPAVAGGANKQETEANARLIAAAPDLLETCEKALTAFRAMYDDMERGVSIEEILTNELYWPLKELRTVIAEAQIKET